MYLVYILDVMLDECTEIGRFHWSFVDAPPLRLMHIGEERNPRID